MNKRSVIEPQYEATVGDIEDIFKEDLSPIKCKKEYIDDLVKENPQTRKEYDKAVRKLNRRHHTSYRKSDMIRAFDKFHKNNLELNVLRTLLRKKGVRSHSGVLVVTVFTSPSKFSCPEDCHYCPDERDEKGNRTQPRSYLSTEPGCRRALKNKFDAVMQFYDRAHVLETIGHYVDKIEVLVLGGTWSFYPVEYQEEFIRDIYYAANTYYSWDQRRDRGSLEEEQSINEHCKCRIIGITLETRPDCIIGENKAVNRQYEKSGQESGVLSEIQRYRRYGVTRVQIGIQHTSDDILKKINRGATNQQSVNAIKLLKENGFKVDIHIMLDLPGSNPTKDLKMLRGILTSQYFQVDYWKIYPCQITPHTTIKKWYEKGLYKPYADWRASELLIRVILFAKANARPWTRYARIIRDIPTQSIIGGNEIPHLRQVCQKRLGNMGFKCACIRCREIKARKVDINTVKLVVRKFPSSDGIEYFISFEAPDDDNNDTILIGFARLRINDPNFENYRLNLFESSQVALIRELHVYGVLAQVKTNNVNSVKTDVNAQHFGFGKRLVKAAEKIAFAQEDCNRLAIISGIGVRQYYRKLGYTLEDTYMCKDLHQDTADNGVCDVDIPDIELYPLASIQNPLFKTTFICHAYTFRKMIVIFFVIILAILFNTF